MPKSPSAGSPNSDTNRFCGLMSRWSRPAVVGGLQRAGDLHADVEHEWDGQASLALQPLTERAPAVQLHHDARLLGRGEGGVEHGDDVRVLRHQPHRPALPLEAAPLALVGQPEHQHLDGDPPVEVALEGAEHVAEPAPPDRTQLVEAVDLDGRHSGVGVAWHGRSGEGSWAGDGKRRRRGTAPRRNATRRPIA